MPDAAGLYRAPFAEGPCPLATPAPLALGPCEPVPLAVGPCEPVLPAAGPCTAPPADLELDAGRDAEDDLGAEAGLLPPPPPLLEPAMAALPALRTPARTNAIKFRIADPFFFFASSNPPYSTLLTLPFVNVTFMSL